MVREEAKKIIQEKFNDVIDLTNDLKERVTIEVNKRLEDWEKYENSERTIKC